MQNNENILEEFEINELEDRVEFGLCGGGGGGSDDGGLGGGGGDNCPDGCQHDPH